MKKSLSVTLLLIGTVCFGQTVPTPNVGLQVPSGGSTNWNLPLNYNFNLLDQLLGGTLKSPGLGLVQKPLFGTGAPTAACNTGIQGSNYYDTSVSPFNEYVCNNGEWGATGGSGGGSGAFPTNAVVFGLTPSTSRGATGADITTLLTPLTNCSTSGFVYSPSISGCISITPFTINSFTGGSVVEIGSTVTNPAFTASYSVTPTSAAITNTDGIDSPVNLVSPFTSGTVTGSFSKTSAASTTFTLTAVGSSTKTATTAIQWEPRVFGGVGTAGATGVTSSGTTAVLAGATGTLASAGLSNSQVGQVLGPYSPSGQKVYLLLIGGSHTFKDNGTGLAFAFNSPTAVSFINQNGDTVSMFLYESTNTLTGTFSVLVVS